MEAQVIRHGYDVDVCLWETPCLCTMTVRIPELSPDAPPRGAPDGSYLTAARIHLAREGGFEHTCKGKRSLEA